MSDIYSQTADVLARLQSLHTPKKQPPYAEVAKAHTYKEPEPLSEKEVEILLDGLAPNPVQNLPEVVNENYAVDFALWETLAYDLALAQTDDIVIAEAYDLTLAQLVKLKLNPYFAKMLQNKKDEVAQLGSDAAFTVKMRMIANQATPQFLQRLTSPGTNTKDFHALFKTAVELAQLVPKEDEDTGQPTAVIGASVTFNIHGVPGLEHLVTTSEIADAQWTEVKSNDDEELEEL